MTQEEIIESNRLIAEFMGAEIKDIGDGQDGYHFPNPVPTEFNVSGWRNKTATKYLYYHTSWDWLMPVYRKIKNYLNEIDRPSNNHVCFGDSLEVDIHCAVTSIEIEKSFRAIVEFIKWYNQTKGGKNE